MSSPNECLACAATEPEIPCDHLKNLQVTPKESGNVLVYTTVKSIDVNMEVVVDGEGNQVLVVKKARMEADQLDAGEEDKDSDTADEAKDANLEKDPSFATAETTV